jgi:hypothetical protein
LKLAKWYSTLSPEARELLKEALDYATETAIFGVLCILDGARVIEDTDEKGEFEVYYVRGKEKQLLNPPSDPLHEGYRKFMSNL